MSVSGTGHSKCPGKSMGTEQAPWNLPAPHTILPVSPHLQLRALPPQGCPEKTKQRLFHQLMWYFGWLHISVYVWRTQSCLSHPCRGSPGIGSSLFSTQKPSWLKETSPEGFKALCNYQDSAEAQFLGIQDLYWKYPKSSRVLAPSTAHYSFSGIYSCISQHRTRIFLSVTDRYCSALSEQL